MQTSTGRANVADPEQGIFHCDFLITSPLKNYKPQTPKSVISITTTTRTQITPTLNIRKNIFSDSEKHSTPIQNQHTETLDLHNASLTSNEDVSVEDANVLDSTYQPDMIEVMGDRNYFQNINLPDELEDLLEKFLQYLNGPDGYQVKSKEIKGEVRRIGIVIEAVTVDDFVNEVKIRDKYLDFCNNKGYKPDSVRKYLRSLSEFYDFLMLRRSELHLSLISNEKILLLQKKLANWSGRYKKPSRERFWERQMEDYQILVDERQIKIYFDHNHSKDATKLFNELKNNWRRISQQEFCLMRDNLFVIIELGNAHRSGVCANMLMDEFKKRELKDGFWMIYVRHHKNFYCSGHAVVTLNQNEMERLETYVFQARKQTKPVVPNVFVSWTGNKMSSGAISTQLCSIWRKIGILKMSDKNMCCNILRKSASTGSREAKDPRTAELADLMAHSENTAGKHYYIRKKQLSAAAGSKSLREVVFKQKNVSAPQMEEPNQIETTELPSILSPRKIWTPEEEARLFQIFDDDLKSGTISAENVREKLQDVRDLNVSVRQITDKLRAAKRKSNNPVVSHFYLFCDNCSFFLYF